MADEKDWKQAYQELLLQHEQSLDSRAETEGLLVRVISRLTVATSGMDPNLDPHLKSIRDAVRNGVKPTLNERLNALSDSLVHQPDSDDFAGAEPLKICGQLVSRLQLPKSEMSEASRLFSHLLSDPAHVAEAELDRLATLLNHAVTEGTHPKDGLFGRLLGSRKGDGSEGDTPNHMLMELLDRASWPGHWGTDISDFQSRLADKPAADEWVRVLRDLLDLTSRSYGDAQTEIQETESFLEELTRRLQELDIHLRSGHDSREAAIKSGRRLNVAVASDVAVIQSSVREETDLGQLKRTVAERLDRIQLSMDQFLADEEQRYQNAEIKERALREHLREMEQESDDIRFRMVEAHHLALQDALTELPNRLAYDERVSQEFARWKRFGEPLSMLVWDVDDFKKINDRYGHQAGDSALRIIAKTLQKRLRETDFIARYGGEEFVTLLCGTDQEKALSVAEEMREAVGASGFHSGTKAVQVSISCGISCFEEGDTVEAVFGRADKALYAAKGKGKNCCELARTPSQPANQ
ncbi:GGDEF domain-containing protein [bacterium endosymbiont of Escarpia laminata]|nr:MAG: GGDEF domain-containing protein [bacterium endosymbiont of Escarpia laminata]